MYFKTTPNFNSRNWIMFKKSNLLLAALALVIFAGCATTKAPAPAKAAPQKAAVKAVKSAPGTKVAKKAKKAKKPVVKYPALTNPQSWTMVVVPDVQTYIKQIENQGIMDMMLAWIVRRRAEMNIQQVLFTGDLVYSNSHGLVNQPNGLRFFRSGKLRDLIGEEQWKAFSRLMERLGGEVPYILSTGNHDYGVGSAENRNSYFDKYFPTDRNPLTRRHLVACAPNAFGLSTLQTAAYEFTAPAPDGRKFLVISLQFAPTDADLAWAKNIADMERFENHIGIVLTHSYIRANGLRIESEKYALSKAGGNPGEQIFQKLVYPAKNIRMVVCGHVCSPDKWESAVGFSWAKNASGKSVAQMVFNTQAIGGGFSGNGGDGWLRLLEFMPDKKTIKATTYSPFFGGSTSTNHMAWKTDERNEFTFTLE